ncbi:cytochrome c [Gluconobacter wancherniae]|uniref:Cytochrome c n=2 Tax=Gluconobacter wancherniae TaxID=1307955 RepID=A0A511B9G9_9PROT|nr:cytochrome c [Gluconobacter wancherniae]GBD57674.1 cytochrome c [Gluconobacter wancherniae NBRC 103581]GBR62298.1 alcohol dehydrogenase cytochrome c subunit [Gluconobacter wancherniae NBRC 103581]GEK94467.1 cytochrome c [Gluconobacter wancherniae NBRC 103581]
MLTGSTRDRLVCNMKQGWKYAAVIGLMAVSFGAAHAQDADEALIKKGEYISRLSDCVACHTALHGQAFAGGLEIKSPIGTIYSTNITPDPTYGIGKYTLQDFTKAVRQGIRKDGSTVYPAMPYPEFARLSDEDISALYAYFMHGVKPVARQNKQPDISWPLSMRWPLSIWRSMFVPSVPKGNDPSIQDPEIARGEYLVNGPGHCGECHTPRGFGMQVKAYDAKGGPVYLSGGAPIDNWIAPSLRSNSDTGLGRWSEDDIFFFLKTGRIDHSAVFGGMADVVAYSTQHWTDDDLRATAKYLKSMPAVPEGKNLGQDDGQTVALLEKGGQGNAGAEVYLHNCAICHMNDGSGVNRMFPPLAGNPVVLTDNPTSLANVVAFGGILPPTNWAPSAVAMPGFKDHLSDQQMADVVNFMRKAWGNNAPGTVSASDISKLRTTGAPVSTAGWNTSSQGWMAYVPQPYGHGWTFSPQTHSGVDNAQ